MNFTRNERRRAEATLRTLLPEAEKRAAQITPAGPEITSPIGRAAHPYLGRAKLSGVHIYYRPPWGWYADVILKDMPDGCPDVMGTPNDSPLASEREARECAIDIVASVLAVEAQRKEEPSAPEPTEQFFDFYGIYLAIPIELKNIVKLSAAALDIKQTEAEMFKRLGEVKLQFFGVGPVTREAIDALSEEGKVNILTVCSIALGLHGIFRFPEDVPDVKDWKG